MFFMASFGFSTLLFVAGRVLFTFALLIQLNAHAHTHAHELGLRLHIWAPSVLVTAGDVTLGAGLVLGGVTPLPVVMAVGATMDLLTLSPSALGPERRLIRTVFGCSAGVVALVLAIWCTPDARAWPADIEQLSLAMESGPVILLLLALAMGLAAAQVLQRAVGPLSPVRASALAVQAATLGVVGLLAVASLAGVLRGAFSEDAAAGAAGTAASAAAAASTTTTEEGEEGEASGDSEAYGYGEARLRLAYDANAPRRLQATGPSEEAYSGLGEVTEAGATDASQLATATAAAAATMLDATSPFQSVLPLQLAAAAAAALALQALSLRAALHHARHAEAQRLVDGMAARLGSMHAALQLLGSTAAVCVVQLAHSTGHKGPFGRPAAAAAPAPALLGFGSVGHLAALQPYAVEAATLCSGGCNPMQWRLSGGCNPMYSGRFMYTGRPRRVHSLTLLHRLTLLYPRTLLHRLTLLHSLPRPPTSLRTLPPSRRRSGRCCCSHRLPRPRPPPRCASASAVAKGRATRRQAGPRRRAAQLRTTSLPIPI